MNKKMMNENEIINTIKESYNKSVCISGYYLACCMKKHNMKWSHATDELYGWGVNFHIMEAMREYCANKIGVHSKIGLYGLQNVIEKFVDKTYWVDDVINAAKFSIKAGIVPSFNDGDSIKKPDGFESIIWDNIEW